MSNPTLTPDPTKKHSYIKSMKMFFIATTSAFAVIGVYSENTQYEKIRLLAKAGFDECNSDVPDLGLIKEILSDIEFEIKFLQKPIPKYSSL